MSVTCAQTSHRPRGHTTPRTLTMARVLWVGGTSALARTYFEEVHPARGVPKVTVAAPLPRKRLSWGWPNWPKGVQFVELDLTSEESVSTVFSRLKEPVDALVLGARASLVWSSPDEHERLSRHLALLLQEAAKHGVTSVLHISSIAVADHVVAQHLVREDDPVPPVEALSSPYDRFKLRCEQIVDASCAANSDRIKVWTHLRISGIFSNDPECIQCTAIRRQGLISVRSVSAIDFNSARNAANALALILERMHAATGPSNKTGRGFSGRQLFYYTRSTQEPVPYWHHVRDYRAATDMRYGLFLPAWVADVSVPRMRRLASGIGTPLGLSLDYLMAVASAEHSADNTRFHTAFPQMAAMEESVFDAFDRIRKLREFERRRDREREPFAYFARSFAYVYVVLFALLIMYADRVDRPGAPSRWGPGKNPFVERT